jgi:hypothetical protein
VYAAHQYPPDSGVRAPVQSYERNVELIETAKSAIAPVKTEPA